MSSESSLGWVDQSLAKANKISLRQFSRENILCIVCMFVIVIVLIFFSLCVKFFNYLSHNFFHLVVESGHIWLQSDIFVAKDLLGFHWLGDWIDHYKT